MDFFDLHCDTVTTAMHQSVGLDCDYLDISFPKNEEIKRHCQCFAIFCPDVISGEDAFNYYTMSKHFFENQLAEFPQFFEQAKTIGDVDRITGTGKTAAILTVEGGRVLGGKIEHLEDLYNDGVRMMTLTWNGENEIGKGSTDQSFSLKPFGIDVIKEMERIRMVIDVSHLSDAGLDDVLKNVDCAVAASHSNLREICGHRRNLTDEYFKEIVHREGIVGLNFYKACLLLAEKIPSAWEAIMTDATLWMESESLKIYQIFMVWLKRNLAKILLEKYSGKTHMTFLQK